MRKILLEKIISLLKQNDFAVSPFLHSNTCFDLISKKHGLSFIIKVFENVDALRPEHAEELQKLGRIFGSNVLIIGEKTKAFSLKDNVIYSRYEISTLTYTTLENILSGQIPYVTYFKGKEIVELDAEKLRELRSRKHLSLSELAQQLDTTTESIHRYEHGAKTSLQTAQKLEDYFNTNLIKEIDLFTKKEAAQELFKSRPEDATLEKMHSIGFGIETFKHTPFKALSASKENLMITPEKSKAEVKRKAVLVKKTKDALDTHSVIITKEEFSRKSIGGSALVQEEELDSYTKLHELLELIKKREKEGKNLNE